MKIKVKTFGLLGMVMMLALITAPVLARGPTGPAGKSNIIQLYLVEKDLADWSVVEDGAWGKMTYNKAGKIVFNGHGLDAEEDYTLINFARDTEWPAHINVLGTGIADDDGVVHIEYNYAYGSLEYDETPETGSTLGYKIWLVLTADIDGNGDLAGWTPEEYLFEDALI